MMLFHHCATFKLMFLLMHFGIHHICFLYTEKAVGHFAKIYLLESHVSFTTDYLSSVYYKNP